jgi:hypothetical protein
MADRKQRRRRVTMCMEKEWRVQFSDFPEFVAYKVVRPRKDFTLRTGPYSQTKVVIKTWLKSKWEPENKDIEAANTVGFCVFRRASDAHDFMKIVHLNNLFVVRVKCKGKVTTGYDYATGGEAAYVEYIRFDNLEEVPCET